MRARLILAAALISAIAASPAAAEPPAAARKAAGDSLLFSSAALALIEAARRGQRDARGGAVATAVSQAEPRGMPSAIHLSAIVYHAPDDWRIWLNGRSFTPAAAPGALEILEVTAGAVRLVWRGDPSRRPQRFELQPNQSYLVASGEVIEGQLPARQRARTVAGARR